MFSYLSSYFKLYYLIIICSSLGLAFIKDNDDNIRRLRKELFKTREYDRMSIPLKNNKDAMNVSIEFTLTNIKGLDIKSQTLVTEGWIQFQWHDERLMWKPSDFNDISVLRNPSQEVFLPDIMLYNTADYTNSKPTNFVPTNVLIYSNGLVMWVPPASFKSLCNLNITKWPFDEHVCELKFGSWTYDGYTLDVRNTKNFVELSDFWQNPEWEITSTDAKRINKFYPCCKEPYPHITFTLNIKRRLNLYHYTILIPAIIAIILSLTSFWLPIRSLIRFVLKGFSLLLMILVLLHLAKNFNLGSFGTPYAIRFVSLTALFIGLSLIWSTIVYNLSLMKRQIPLFAKKLVPMIHVLYKNYENESIGLTHSEDTNEKKITEPTFESLITVLDKMVFVLFAIAICLVHI